ncbi:MAG: SPOR domain-containing protein [Bacteroidota bacterium]
MRLILLCVITCFSGCFTLFSQEGATDTLCCNCLKYSREEIEKVIVFKDLIREIDPSYIHHVQSLGENIDLVRFEKFNYLLKLDKYLKYELNKKMFALENKKDSASLARKKELEQLNEALRQKADLLNFKITECEKLEIIRRYISKKNIINSLDPEYYTNFTGLINSTIDENKRDYPRLIELDRKLLAKLEAKKEVLAARAKINSSDSLNLVLLDELLMETGERLKKSELEQIHEKIMPDETPAERSDASGIYFLKELIISSDTLQFGFNGTNEKKIVVVNNTMYIFRNDSLVETIKNEDNSQVASIFDNKKPISIDNYDGLFYTIQIGTFSKEVSARDLKVKSNLFYKKLPNGHIRYSFGMFNDLEEVEAAKKLLESIGITDMVVIAYHKKEKITLKEARRLKEGMVK